MLINQINANTKSSHNSSKFASIHGFTLVELLIVVAVLMIITAFTLPAFTNFFSSESLKQASEQVLSDLRAAQSRSQTGVTGPSGQDVCWGIKVLNTGDITNTSYVVGYNLTSNCSSSTSTIDNPTTVKLPGGVSATQGGAIVFLRVTGVPATGIDIILTLNGQNKHVIVEAGGNMYVQ